MEHIFDLFSLSSEEDLNLAKILSRSSDWLLRLLLVISIGLISHLVSKKIINRNFELFSRTFKNKINLILLEEKVTKPLDFLLPGIAILFISPFLLKNYEHTSVLVRLISQLLIAFSLMNLTANSINSFCRILSVNTKLRNKPIKSVAQFLKILNYIFGTLFIISIIIHRDITNIFTALGALMAVIILIFKDTILGFISSLQISADDTVREGDWVTFEEHGADGTVIHIGLTVVKIINFDNTISSIPTYSFTTKSFKNWRGMSDSGVRRIKRAITFNINSIKFVNLEDYKQAIEGAVIVSSAKITNLGIFRLYIENYIRNHPLISKNAVILVRQLQSTEFGVALEVYCFANDTKWENYERIQAEIFEHLFAKSQEFDLAIFQRPANLRLDEITPKEALHTY